MRQQSPQVDSPGIAWLVAGGAVLLAIGTALGVVLDSLPSRRVPLQGISLRSLLGPGSITWYGVAISALPLTWAVRRFPIDRRNWKHRLPLYVLAVAALTLMTTLALFQLLELPANVDRQTLARLTVFRMLTESTPFWLLIAGLHALEFYRRDRRREVETARLSAQLAESRLDALSAQLQPHFLFNTLQGVSTLIHRDPLAADTMLTRLADLLRRSLDTRGEHRVRLGEELEIVELYVAIWRARFPDRLEFEVDVAEEAMDTLVPSFILQPLLENAFQHGIARRAGAGRVVLSARLLEGRVELSVVDDGPGLSGLDCFPAEGIGLSNTRQRLSELYGENHSLILDEGDGTGLKVVVTIPHELQG
jgi:signal transduction histidine kinase